MADHLKAALVEAVEDAYADCSRFHEDANVTGDWNMVALAKLNAVYLEAQEDLRAHEQAAAEERSAPAEKLFYGEEQQLLLFRAGLVRETAEFRADSDLKLESLQAKKQQACSELTALNLKRTSPA